MIRALAGSYQVELTAINDSGGYAGRSTAFEVRQSLLPLLAVPL
jgi:hypothetical protein